METFIKDICFVKYDEDDYITVKRFGLFKIDTLVVDKDCSEDEFYKRCEKWTMINN